jgi:hypothetical protein
MRVPRTPRRRSRASDSRHWLACLVRDPLACVSHGSLTGLFIRDSSSASIFCAAGLLGAVQHWLMALWDAVLL